MSNLLECCHKYNIYISKIKYFNSYIIIYSGNKLYFVSKLELINSELIEYFKNIDYNYFLSLIGIYDNFYLYSYCEEIKINEQKKAEKFISALGELHKKSMSDEIVTTDDITVLYQSIDRKIKDLEKYYFDLQNRIEEDSFLKIDFYFLLKNISIFYKSLYLSMNKIVRWYENHSLSVRKGYILHNSSLNNFCVSYDSSYFFDFSLCKKDLLIYDFVEFYKENALNVDMFSIVSSYQKYICFSDEEWDLIYSLILIPNKIDFSYSVYDNVLCIRKEIDYLEKTFSFMSKKDEENQKTNEDEFKE